MLVNVPMVVRYAVRSLVGRATWWCTHDVIQANDHTNVMLAGRLSLTVLIWCDITKYTVVPNLMCAMCVDAALQRKVTWMVICVYIPERSRTHVMFALAVLLTGVHW